jgi:hypothetical protein
MGRSIIPSQPGDRSGSGGLPERWHAHERLDVERQDGTRFALSYMDLKWVAFQPSEGSLHLHFATHYVRIVGQNLDPLYGQLLVRQLGRIAVDLQRVNTSQSDDATFVEEIVVMQKPGPTDGMEEYDADAATGG